MKMQLTIYFISQYKVLYDKQCKQYMDVEVEGSLRQIAAEHLELVNGRQATDHTSLTVVWWVREGEEGIV